MNNSTENGRCRQDTARFCVPASAADYEKSAVFFHVQTPKGAENHASIPRGEEQGVHGDVQLPPAGQVPVPESQGPAVADFVPPGRLGLYPVRPVLHQPGKQGRYSFRCQRIGAGRVLERHQTTDESGKFSSNEYIIHEQPVSFPPSLGKPSSENPTTGKPTSENPTQLNKDRETKDQAITDPSITHSFPSLSPPPAGAAVAASPPEGKRREAATQSAVEIYRELIKENIEYDHLLHYSKIDREELDGIVELLVETVCTARKTIRVAGDDYPAELVKAKLLKLNSGHIEFVMDCMRENTTKIRNIKKYLLAVLFNAPSTMGSYYTALVAHDMAEGKI